MNGYCSQCGGALPPSSRFCPACGTVVAGYSGTGYQASYGSSYGPFPRLVRPLFGRQFAGVCMGIAQNHGWDVGMVRFLAIVTGVFLAPIPEILYLAGWIAIPEELPMPAPMPPVAP